MKAGILEKNKKDERARHTHIKGSFAAIFFFPGIIRSVAAPLVHGRVQHRAHALSKSQADFTSMRGKSASYQGDL